MLFFTRFLVYLTACGLPFLFLGCTEDTPKQEAVSHTPSTVQYAVKMVLPHDPQAFTQGLLYANGTLYESTGGDNSWIAVVDPQTGKHDKKVFLDPAYFGEGIAVLGKKIYQLTWRSKVGFVYNLATFKKILEFPYDFEGWGITTDQHHLIMSDGTDRLHFLDTTSLKVAHTLYVKENGSPVDKLNELEYAEGAIYANRWQTPFIYKIDPRTGTVIGKIDLSVLVKEIELENPKADVLNGIAYQPTTRDFLVTGKWWHKAFVLSIK